MKHHQACIIAAYRSPIGKFCGNLSSFTASQLSANLVKNILSKHKNFHEYITEVIIGHVLQSGCGQNTARQTTLDSGLDYTVHATTINKLCGSGMCSIINAINTIYTEKYAFNRDNIIIAGGHENMSRAPHIINIRSGTKMGDTALIDSMMHDGLFDAKYKIHMGITAENLAKKYKIDRVEQDEFALHSHLKAIDSVARNAFSNEIVNITINNKKKEKIEIYQDESIRENITMGDLAKLNPAFIDNGTVTAGNSSPINDGAAILAITDVEYALKLNIPILARIQGFATVGVDPQIMGIGPVAASNLALSKSNWNIESLDLIESNEAFAAQAIAVNREMGWNTNRVNVRGGAIALGHPIGASGARIIVTLIHSLINRGGGRGLATLCVGGGMGVAICVEV